MNRLQVAQTVQVWPRYDVKRQQAERAYEKQAQYNGKHQQFIKALQEEPAIVKTMMPSLEAGQVKQIALPLGKTLEETIQLWKDVRRDAVSQPEPTTADYQLAAKASAKIRQTEAQIALHERAQSEAETEAVLRRPLQSKIVVNGFESPATRFQQDVEKRLEQAVSAYTFQVTMKEKGFPFTEPSFYRIA